MFEMLDGINMYTFLFSAIAYAMQLGEREGRHVLNYKVFVVLYVNWFNLTEVCIEFVYIRSLTIWSKSFWALHSCGLAGLGKHNYFFYLSSLLNNFENFISFISQIHTYTIKIMLFANSLKVEN